MSYSPSLVAEASKQLDLMRKKRQQDSDTAQEQAYAKDPKIREIDGLLRGTMSKIMGCSLRPDPSIRIEDLKKENLSLQQERGERLLALGISPKVLGQLYLCDHCQDSGWIGKTMCSCLRKHCIQAQLEELGPLLRGNQHHFAQFDLNYYSRDPWAGAPTSPYENMVLIHQIAYNYAENFGKSNFRNLFFYGAIGLGKTFLSACIARAVAEQGFSVSYGTANAITQNYDTKQFLKKDAEEYARATLELNNCLQSDLLILDDLGTENGSPAKDSGLYELINSRLLRNQCSIISTNLAMEELNKRYSPQIMSRIDGEYTSCSFFGEDVRKLKKER